MATAFNPSVHYSFINDLPIRLVTEFLVKKRVVHDAHNAHMLYTQDIRQYQIQGPSLKSVAYDDFMAIFCKRMFVHTLLEVIKKIENLGGGEKTQSNKSEEHENPS